MKLAIFINKKVLFSLIVGVFIFGFGHSNLRAETVEQCIAKSTIQLNTDLNSATIILNGEMVICAAIGIWGPPGWAAFLLCSGAAATHYTVNVALAYNNHNGRVAICNLE